MSASKPFKIYKASAGSGKTFTIVREYLTLCLGGNDNAFSEILAVTFTNKAANEMKAKIMRFLLGISEGSDNKEIKQMRDYLLKALNITENVLVERSNRLYTNILHNYSDMAVCTIDSFVQRLSRSFARELDLPGQYSVILDNDDLVDEIIRRVSDEIGKDDFITDIMSSFVEYNLSEETSWNVKKLLGEFIGKLLSEDAYRKGNYKNYTELDEPKYHEIKAYVKTQNEIIKRSLPLIVNEIDEAERRQGIVEDDYSGKSARGLLTVKKKMSEGQSNVVTPGVSLILKGEKPWKSAKSRIADDSIVDVYNEAISKYNSLNSKKLIYETIEKDLYLYVLRNHIFELIKKYIAETSQVHISEFNKRISDILGDCSVPFIYERIGEKYKHYFIDEFQDTSVLQWHNFLPLVENSLASGNINLLVGDAKQSIYRFRGGEVEQIISLPDIYKRPAGAFGQQCETRFVGSAQKMSLGTNFRSSKDVVKFNNTFFRNAGRYLHYDDVYSDVEQMYNPQKPNGYVSVAVFPGDLKVAQYKAAVKRQILKQIQDLHAKDVDYNDITILVRSNADGTDIANYLVENGVEVVSAESLLLQSSDKVQLIIHSLMLMSDGDNPVARKAVGYYSEKCGCALDGARPNIAATAQTGGIYDICMQICKSYGFNIVEDVFLQYFMNMVFDWQSRHSSGIDDFLEYWDKKKDKLAVQLSGDLNSVQITTIHKAKGLEYKVVIYPYADTVLHSQHGFTQSEMWLQCADFEDTKDIPHLDAFLLKLSKEKLAGTSLEHLVEKENDKTMLDILDMMYVAMTRAKNMLFVYTTDKKSDKPEYNYNLFTDFFDESNQLDFKHVAIENDVAGLNDFFIKQGEIKGCPTDDFTLYNYGDFDATILNVNEKDSKDDKIKILGLNDGEVASKAVNWFDKLKVEADPTMVWAEKDTFRPDQWGLLVHEILSKILTIDDAEKALRPYVNDGTIDEKLAAKLLAIFRKVTEIKELKPAFAEDAVVKNEMDIHISDGRIIRPDRYAETKNGVILIDYKTGREHETYYNQLREYMYALMQMNGNQQIKAYLVYLGDEVKATEVKLDGLF